MVNPRSLRSAFLRFFFPFGLMTGGTILVSACKAAGIPRRPTTLPAFCTLEFDAGELGEFNLRFERAFTPLRWGVRRRSRGYLVRLFDDSGRPGTSCSESLAVRDTVC